ncbi:MAG: hypothetical protein Ct9H300mP25_16220 [Acidobacteriota bacterium]|nr:MAG: hypothetical protein Ct9H300mP25_16220 [Acidobacteriota bacterium]
MQISRASDPGPRARGAQVHSCVPIQVETQKSVRLCRRQQKDGCHPVMDNRNPCTFFALVPLRQVSIVDLTVPPAKADSS